MWRDAANGVVSADQKKQTKTFQNEPHRTLGSNARRVIESRRQLPPGLCSSLFYVVFFGFIGQQNTHTHTHSPAATTRDFVMVFTL